MYVRTGTPFRWQWQDIDPGATGAFPLRAWAMIVRPTPNSGRNPVHCALRPVPRPKLATNSARPGDGTVAMHEGFR